MSRSRRWSPRARGLARDRGDRLRGLWRRGAPRPSRGTVRRHRERGAERRAGERRAVRRRMAYPETGEAPCGQAEAPDASIRRRTRATSRRSRAPDAKTVVFELCNPDVAFLSKIAFTSFAINDTAWLESKIDPAETDEPGDRRPRSTAPGPYKLEAWNRGSDITMAAQRRLLGRQGQDREADLPLGHGGRPAARRAPGRARSTASTTSAPTDFPTVEGNAGPAAQAARGPQHHVPRLQQHSSRRSTTRRSARRSRWASTASASSTTSTRRARRSRRHFTPCSIPNGCEGDAWYEFDAGGRQGAAGRGRLPGRLRDQDPATATSSVATCRTRRRRPGPPGSSSKTNLNITATHRRAGVGHLHRQRRRRRARRAPPARLGRRLSGRHELPRLPLRRRGVGAVRRQVRRHHRRRCTEGAAGADDAAREPSYAEANNAIKTHVPMIPIAHGGSGDGLPGRRRRTPTRRRSATSTSRSMTPGRPHPVRLDAERRAARPVLRRRVRRRVAPRLRADDGGALRLRDRRHGRRAGPGRGLRAERRARPSGPARSARASRSTTARRSTPTTSSCRYAVQWDAEHPLHKGRDGSFAYFPGLFGGFLNPPPPAPAG